MHKIVMEALERLMNGISNRSHIWPPDRPLPVVPHPRDPGFACYRWRYTDQVEVTLMTPAPVVTTTDRLRATLPQDQHRLQVRLDFDRVRRNLVLLDYDVPSRTFADSRDWNRRHAAWSRGEEDVIELVASWIAHGERIGPPLYDVMGIEGETDQLIRALHLPVDVLHLSTGTFNALVHPSGDEKPIEQVWELLLLGSEGLNERSGVGRRRRTEIVACLQELSDYQRLKPRLTKFLIGTAQLPEGDWPWNETG